METAPAMKGDRQRIGAIKRERTERFDEEPPGQQPTERRRVRSGPEAEQRGRDDHGREEREVGKAGRQAVVEAVPDGEPERRQGRRQQVTDEGALLQKRQPLHGVSRGPRDVAPHNRP